MPYGPIGLAVAVFTSMLYRFALPLPPKPYSALPLAARLVSLTPRLPTKFACPLAGVTCQKLLFSDEAIHRRPSQLNESDRLAAAGVPAKPLIVLTTEAAPDAGFKVTSSGC